MLFSTGARIPAVSSQAQVAAFYDEMPLEIAQPVMYAQPEPIVYAQPEGSAAGDLSWVLPGVAVLAVSAVAGAYVSRARADAELEAEEEEDVDLEAALDAAEAVALAGPLYIENTLENKVAMLFSSGKSVKGKAAAAKKPAAKKPAPKKAAPKKPAPKKPVAKKPVRGALKGPSLQGASSTIPFLQELFSLSAVGGGQGNTLR